MKRALKRAMDLMIAMSALLIAAPVFVAIAVAIRLNMGSPVLFRQVRIGRRGERFVLLKFRTMIPPASSDEEYYDAGRLTRLGGWLRRTSLDELPQLMNVVRGELSLVGPRPLLPEYLPLYTAEQARRHDVKPGITGLAQINGRDAVEMERRFEQDVWYVDNWSLSLDVAILVRTTRSVVQPSGVEFDGSPTQPLWQGNAAVPVQQLTMHTPEREVATLAE